MSVQKQQGRKRLILGGRGDPSLRRQMVQECRDLGCTHVPGMTAVVEAPKRRIELAVQMGKPGDIIAGARFKADLFRLVVKQSESRQGRATSPTLPLADRKRQAARSASRQRSSADARPSCPSSRW